VRKIENCYDPIILSGQVRRVYFALHMSWKYRQVFVVREALKIVSRHFIVSGQAGKNYFFLLFWKCRYVFDVSEALRFVTSK